MRHSCLPQSKPKPVSDPRKAPQTPLGTGPPGTKRGPLRQGVPPPYEKAAAGGGVSDGSLMTIRRVSTSAIHDRLRVPGEGAPE
jgi:hypothetical protein